MALGCKPGASNACPRELKELESDYDCPMSTQASVACDELGDVVQISVMFLILSFAPRVNVTLFEAGIAEFDGHDFDGDWWDAVTDVVEPLKEQDVVVVADRTRATNETAISLRALEFFHRICTSIDRRLRSAQGADVE